MHDNVFDKIAAAGGLGFTALGLSTLALAPPAPPVDATAAEVRSYLTDDHARFGLSTIVMTLAVLALLPFLALLHRRIAERRADSALPGSFLIAAGATVTLALAGSLMGGMLGQYAQDGIDDSTLLALHRLWYVVAFAGPPITMAVVLSILGVVIVRDHLYPLWIGWVALVSAVGGLVTALMNIGTSTRAPFVLDTGSFVLSCVVLTAVSVVSLGRHMSTPDDRVVTRVIS